MVLVLNLSKKIHGSMDGTTGIGFFFFKKNLHTRLVLGIRAQLWTLVLGFKANVGLAFGRYRVHISGIETNLI